MNTALVPFLTLSLVAPLAAQGTTWVVDLNGGAGSHFTAIQPAIDAAVPGDTIVVRDGAYNGFTCSKGVTVLGEGNPRLTGLTGPLAMVADVPRGQTFALKNLQIRKWGVGLAIHSNQGRIHLDDVFVSTPYPSVTGAGCQVLASPHVTITGGSLEGSPGLECGAATVVVSDARVVGRNAQVRLGNHTSTVAIDATDSLVQLSFARVQGGGGDSYLGNSLPGSHGIQTLRTNLHATGDAGSYIWAGGGAATRSAIFATGGRISVESSLWLTASGGGQPIAGTATVIRRPIVALRARGGPPGGSLGLDVFGPTHDPVFVAVAAPGELVRFGFGTLGVELDSVVSVYVGALPATVLTRSIPIPNLPALRGSPVAAQAAISYGGTVFELSNVAVVLLH